jgi:hypothetical protein
MSRGMTRRLSVLSSIGRVALADRLIPENRHSHRLPPTFLESRGETEMAYTLDELNHFFSYDPDSGLVYHRNCVKKKWREGTPAGYLKSDGYLMLNILGRSVAYARAAWMLYYQKDVPAGMQVDHINHDRGDHRIANLRLVTPQQNSQMRRRRSPNGCPRYPIHPRARKIDAVLGA